MHDEEIQPIQAAIAALQGQRATLGDAVLELALAPLRERLAALLRPAGLQHRQVAVLFADVVGSTAMAQALEAEDTLEILGGTMRRMADIVEAHQGRVLRFTGDGVKAAFGMDVVREDDAERAVRAGLAMLEAGRVQAELVRRVHGVDDFALRVGVHTGDVALGAGIDADNTAMGAAVNIAARMEQSAPAGALRISHETWSLVRGLFEVEPQPPLPVKGVGAPMTTYLVRAARDPRVASVERGLQGLVTPLVGRQAERARLQQAVTRAHETRQLQALTLVGDAGLGKSRLLRDLVAGLGGCTVLTVRAQPHGVLQSWGLLRSLLVAQCGVADTDSAETARRKVVDGLAGASGGLGAQQAQLIGQLAGLDFNDSPAVRGLDPRSLRDQAFAALRAWLQALAAGGAPPLLVVEDLQWADDSSLDLLQHLVSHAAELPLALFMTGRPALLARRPDWAAADGLVRLAPLAAAECGELAQALLQRMHAVPQQLRELIVGRAEGNPYYMEELVRRLIDEGAIAVDGPRWFVQVERLDQLRLPGTLVGLLQARLDALPAAQRLAARQASIIGAVFWDDALRALDAEAPRALPALQHAAFVRAHDQTAFEGTAELQFDHHLLHQVTYDTLLKAERRLGHGAAARWLAARTHERGAEFVAMTGEHAERAGDAALAIDCFEQAAKAAQQRFANSAAMAWLRRALGLLGETSPARRLDLLHRLQVLCDVVGDRAEQGAVIDEMAALLERHPDPARQAALLLSTGMLAERRSDLAASQRHTLQALALAERCGVAETAAVAAGQLAFLCVAGNDAAAARIHADNALRWAARIKDDVARAEGEGKLLVVSAMISTMLCRFEAAREALLAALARGDTLGAPRLQLGALDNLAELDGRLGRWREVAEWGERMRSLARAKSVMPRLAHAERHIACAAAALEDPATALAAYEQVLSITRANGDRRVLAASLQQLGTLWLALDDAQRAGACQEEAQSLHLALDDAIGACEAAAEGARCSAYLGRGPSALSAVNTLLARLGGDLAEHRAHETLALRWSCQRVLDRLGDSRASPLLEQLFADVQRRAAELTDAADRERLIQALPVFRGIVAAHAGR